jgi:hypothetical protein
MTAPISSTALTLPGTPANAAVLNRIRNLADAWVRARQELAKPALVVDPQWVVQLVDASPGGQWTVATVVSGYTTASGDQQKDLNQRNALRQFEQDTLAQIRALSGESPAEARQILTDARDRMNRMITDAEGQTVALQESVDQLNEVIRRLPRRRRR